MSLLWMWLVVAGTMLYGLSNVFDSYLANRLFRKPSTLLFFTTLINLIFLPLIFFIQVPGIPPLNLLPFFVFLGLVDVAYLYPYYKALESDETSVVVSLFAIDKIFVPFLAFLIVGEVLTLTQYFGFTLVLLSSLLLTLHHHGKFRLNKSFLYMALCSLLLAFEGVVYKYVFENVSWSTGFSWALIFSFLIVLPMLLFKHHRTSIRLQVKKFERKIHIFVSNELLSFGGAAALTFAVSIAPITFIKGVDSIQPLFVLIYAILLTRFFPKMFREKVDLKNIEKKLLLFALMIVGILIIAG
ncbi:MAG: EamA family transporter [Candidatus Aenigmarchaeota archaeon]|nr:EamA family transporter [Candidatus Aenigmarchaeota archaeon]